MTYYQDAVMAENGKKTLEPIGVVALQLTIGIVVVDTHAQLFKF